MKIEQKIHFCTRCLNTYRDQTKLEEHMLRSLDKKFVTFHICIQIKKKQNLMIGK